jgi:acid phosphatase
LLLKVIILALLCGVSSACFGQDANADIQAQSPAGYASRHVVLLMLENRSDAKAMQYMPYLRQLANRYASGKQVYSASHGSWLAYGELVGGIAPKGGRAQNGACNGAGCRRTLHNDNLVRHLRNRGDTWKGYFQGIPFRGFMGYHSGLYVRKHNPFPYFSDVKGNGKEQQRMVPDWQLYQDLAAGTLPNFSMIVPDLQHDGHNPAAAPTALKHADSYLAAMLPRLLASRYFRPGGDGVLIITFDESDLSGDRRCGTRPETNRCGGHVFFAVLGPRVKHGFASNIPHHQRDILRTECDLLRLGSCPGDGAAGKGMRELFR